MISGVLMLEGWLEFNRRKWGVQPVSIRLAPPGAELPAVCAVLFLDRQGVVRMPSGNPYLAVRFSPTPTRAPVRQGRQWLEVAAMLAAEMRRRGVADEIRLPPDVVDARPWQWAGFRVEVKYTFRIDFPHDQKQIDPAVRKNVSKAQRGGYICALTTDMRDVAACLQDTERRQHFSHLLTHRDLELARQLLGADHMRAYACYGPGGDPAAARVVLCKPGQRALDWVAGTRAAHLHSGATQLLIGYVLADLEASGARGFDFAGANLPAVASAKANWGGRLVPYCAVEPYTVRQVARWLRDWWRFRRYRLGGGTSAADLSPGVLSGRASLYFRGAAR